jgi:mannobiose 2-epimerase
MRIVPVLEEIQTELQTNLLPFWRQRSVDQKHGGFIARMSRDGQVDSDAPHGLILNSRLLWTFSALYRRLEDARDLELADRAYFILLNRFHDTEHGGFVWQVAPNGDVLDTEKKIYGQAFCVYALSEHYLATGRKQALDTAKQVFELVEEHARDTLNGGYLESRSSDWSASHLLQLAPNDMVAAKSMNTHLHLLEALTNLYRAWPEERVEQRLRELIEIFKTHILGEGHLHHFFDDNWKLLSNSYTFGHDIEATWLLCEAAEAIGDDRLLGQAQRWALKSARAVSLEALGADGGLAYEGRNGMVIDERRDWWCQAEAVVGFWNAYQITGDDTFARTSRDVWRFISTRIVDRVYGEWHWRIGPYGLIDERKPKVSEWKGPYHNVRMCLEILKRTELGEGGMS